MVPANFAGESFGPFEFELHLPQGDSQLTLRCPLPQVKLWQPWELGLPHLYNISLTLTAPNGEVLDTVSQRTGFRVEEVGGNLSVSSPLCLTASLPFVRGLNWVPADSLPGRLRCTDYERLLTMVKEANANLLRVWGGGLREKQAFYDLCDELGLLVWQEFPFACEFLGAFPRDAEYLAVVERECGDIVRQLRRHPSLALWCGGNEFSRQRNRPLLNTLARLVRHNDGGRPFIPTSPGPGDAHNWQVWHGLAPIHAYQKETSSFLSEFGLQSTNNEQRGILRPSSSVHRHLSARYADMPKLVRYTSMFNDQSPFYPSSFVLHPSQMAQAIALQTAIEHMRRRQGQAHGLCVWQFNEPWPAVSWAIVDYFGRPKLAYEWLKNLYNPVLVCLEFPIGRRYRPGDSLTAAVWVINDTAESINNYQLEIQGVGFRIQGSEFRVQGSELEGSGQRSAVSGRFSGASVPPNSVRRIGQVTLTYQLVKSNEQISSPTDLPHPTSPFTISLSSHGKLLSQNQYYLNWTDLPPAPALLRLRQWLAKWVLW